MDFITVKEATKIVSEEYEDFGTEEVNFKNTLGRVLKEDIEADRHFPPFNRVCMDGIAIEYSTFISGKRSYQIESIQAAGIAQLTLNSSECCIEVMTGAVLPKNTNVVIPYEQVAIKNGIANVQVDEVKKLQNVHLEGLDRMINDVLIKKNTVITPAEIGILATVGKIKVQVAKQPKVIVISTGNELISVEEVPLAHQIRRSNAFTIVALLVDLGIQAESAHIRDDKQALHNDIKGFLKDYDVLLFSGAVSKGKYDFIPEILDDLGVEKLFHKVKQRPGKPFWFGKKEKTTIFAFPGNPVSTYVSCLKYFKPWYDKSMGVSRSIINEAVLSENFSFKPSLTYFLQVKLHQVKGKIIAKPITGKGSGDLANLVDADGFLELQADRAYFTRGEVFPIIQYRN